MLSSPTAAVAAELCIDLIGETAPAAAAFKANIAFFETFGAAGWSALGEVVAAVPADIPIIIDAKRGDIGSTAAAYADALFDGLGADAVTVNPYLGADSVEPFLRPDKVIFVLVRTSNPGGAELQELRVTDGRSLFEHVVDRFAGPSVGYVVGATVPDALRVVRQQAPEAWILAPGVGAQGADLAAAVAAAKRPDGLGVLVPVSRAIVESSDPAATADDLRRAINATAPAASSDHLDRLATALHEAGCVRFGAFTLKSGEESPIYVDLRRLAGRPEVLRMVAAALGGILGGLEFDHIAAIPYAALPIGTAIALATDASLVYPRREAKDYGTKAAVEGVFAAGDSAVVIDDLTTSGGSKLEAIERLAAAGLSVTDVVVLIDRQGGGSEALAAAGYRSHAVFSLRDLVDRLHRTGAITNDQHAAVVAYVA